MRPVLLEQQNGIFIVLRIRSVEVKLESEERQSWLVNLRLDLSAANLTCSKRRGFRMKVRSFPP